VTPASGQGKKGLTSKDPLQKGKGICNNLVPENRKRANAMMRNASADIA
jgi:hypothetical protein